MRFAHAVAQSLADDHGLDVLHIKGPAVDERLAAITPDSWEEDQRSAVGKRRSTDADVLVRPEQTKRLIDVMVDHGWELRYGFNDGSPFAHAATLEHSLFGYVDLHRRFPGLEVPPQVAFERLWS